MNNEQKILEILSRLDERMTAVEGGKITKGQETKTPKPLSKSEAICQKVRNDLKTKEVILLSDYAKGGELKWSRQILSKDKSVKVIKDGRRTFVLNAQTPEKPKPSEYKPVVVVVKQKRRYTKHNKHPTHQGTKARIEAVKKYLETGKSLTRMKIQRICGCSHGTARVVMLAFKDMKGYTIGKGAGKTSRMILSRKGFEAKHQPPMLKKSAYTLFMANRLKQLRNSGLNNADAWRTAVADWNSRGKPIPSTPQSQFPTFQSVKTEYQPILAGVLDKLVKGVAVDYRGVAYALDISSEKEYKALIEEIIQKWEQIKTYFGASGDLKWDGITLKLA
jgi:hypothetical protein